MRGERWGMDGYRKIWERSLLKSLFSHDTSNRINIFKLLYYHLQDHESPYTYNIYIQPSQQTFNPPTNILHTPKTIYIPHSHIIPPFQVKYIYVYTKPLSCLNFQTQNPSLLVILHRNYTPKISLASLLFSSLSNFET